MEIYKGYRNSQLNLTTHKCTCLTCIKLNLAKGICSTFKDYLCVHSFFSHSSLPPFYLSSSLWWECDRVFRIHPFSQLPPSLPTQQRLWLAYRSSLWLCHLPGFHQVIRQHQNLNHMGWCIIHTCGLFTYIKYLVKINVRTWRICRMWEGQ